EHHGEGGGADDPESGVRGRRAAIDHERAKDDDGDHADRVGMAQAHFTRPRSVRVAVTDCVSVATKVTRPSVVKLSNQLFFSPKPLMPTRTSPPMIAAAASAPAANGT